MPTYTLLSINGITIPDAASRGISVQLQPEDNGTLERDVNGHLVDMTLDSLKKYRVSISCTDNEAPDLGSIFRGSGPFTVILIPNLGVSDTTDGTLTLSMMVDSWQVTAHEWDAASDWQIDLIQD